MFCDDFSGEAISGGEKTCIYCFDPCCNHWAETNLVVPNSKVLFAIQCWNLNIVRGVGKILSWNFVGRRWADGEKNKFLIGQNFPVRTWFTVCE